MALRTFIRLLALALAAVPLSFLLWDGVGLLPMLVGLALLGLVLVYLALLAGGGDLTCWQLRDKLSEFTYIPCITRCTTGFFTISYTTPDCGEWAFVRLDMPLEPVMPGNTVSVQKYKYISPRVLYADIPSNTWIGLTRHLNQVSPREFVFNYLCRGVFRAIN